MSAPYNYDFINAYNGMIDPSTVHCKNTNLVWFFKRYLLQRAFSVFKWTLPKTWNLDYFRYVLYNMGYIVVVNTDSFGVIPMIAGLRGYNVFYQPTHAIITNPLINGILEPEIDSQCTLIKLTPDFAGITDLVTYYANLMGVAGEAAGMNLINSKLAYMAAAKSKAMAEAIKKLFDTVQAGNPFVVYDNNYKDADNNPLLELVTQNLKENFIAPDIMLSIRKLENEFDSKIGLANVNSEKKERLISDEVQANRDETYSLAEIWFESLKDGINKTKEMFGNDVADFKIEWRFPHNERDTLNPGTLSSGPNVI